MNDQRKQGLIVLGQSPTRSVQRVDSLNLCHVSQRLGEEVNVKPNEGSKSSYVDIDQEPIVTFIFRYKPLGESSFRDVL